MIKEELEIKRKELHAKQLCLKGKIGDRYETTDGLFCTVIGIEGSRRFVVFEDGFKTSTKLTNLQRGICRNKQFTKVWGVGICEKGKHIAQINGKGTKLYDHWTAMLNRCYNPNGKKYNGLRYDGVTVDERFHRFQDFAEWCTQQIGYNQGFVLDKDLLAEGKRMYSPDHCVFVPLEINNVLSSSKASRGIYPIGVHKDIKSGKFVAQINENKTRKCLGYFKTVEEAFEVYKQNKERQLKEVAERWSGKVDLRVTEALLNYEVKITD